MNKKSYIISFRARTDIDESKYFKVRVIAVKPYTALEYLLTNFVRPETMHPEVNVDSLDFDINIESEPLYIS